jgi:transposase
MIALPNLSQMSDAHKDALILELFQTILKLQARTVELETTTAQLQAKLSLNSTNSSKPPSSDGYAKPAPKSQRIPGQRPSGGQKGHIGTTLRQSSSVDETVVHRAPNVCTACQKALPAQEIADTRQVFDIPPIKVRVTEHQLMRAVCSCGQVHLGVWPDAVTAPAQYGINSKAMAVHLNQHHLVPMARTSAFMQDAFGLNMGQASIQRAAKELADRLGATVKAIGQAVQASAVVHVDETGIRLKSKLHWLHCAVTDSLTWLGWHSRRGTKAFGELGILAGVQGVMVHDGLAGYRQFDCLHSLCNAHHIRELVFAHEQDGHIWDGWAKEMIDLLVKAKNEVAALVACATSATSATSPALSGSVANVISASTPAPLQAISQDRQAWFLQQWELLLVRAESFNPQTAYEGRPKKGRPKNSKTANLLRRLRDNKADVWRFMTHPGVPFTNNLAEQALRMAKVKQKISGCFRTDHGADTFCTIRSYLATMHKQKHCLYDCLVSAFAGNPTQPRFVA